MPSTPPPAEVSGQAFLGLAAHVKKTEGKAALDLVVRQGNAPLRAAFAERIGVLGWYPYEAYADFLTGLVRVAGGGKLEYARELGAAAGVRDINTVFRVYRTLGSPERLIRACGKIWLGYYRGCGTMEALAWSPARTVLRISGFPTMNPAHCRLMEGWMVSTMEQLGAQVYGDARETHCNSRGDPYHEFACRWRLK
jgi:hypothetical protein